MNTKKKKEKENETVTVSMEWYQSREHTIHTILKKLDEINLLREIL